MYWRLSKNTIITIVCLAVFALVAVNPGHAASRVQMEAPHLVSVCVIAADATHPEATGGLPDRLFTVRWGADRSVRTSVVRSFDPTSDKLCPQVTVPKGATTACIVVRSPWTTDGAPCVPLYDPAVGVTEAFGLTISRSATAQIPPASDLYPLTIAMQPTIKGGSTVAYAITVTLSKAAKFRFGPWVTVDSARTLLSQDCDARPSPFPGWSLHPACYLGPMRPGESRQIVVSYPIYLNSSSDDFCDVSFTLRDNYYRMQTHVWMCDHDSMK